MRGAASLSASGGGGHLTLIGKEPGKTAVALSVSEGGFTNLNFADKSGRIRIMIGLLPDGTPGLAIYDEGGKPRIVLGATTFDVPRDTKIRKDGGKLLSTSSLAIFDENEKLMFQAP